MKTLYITLENRDSVREKTLERVRDAADSEPADLKNRDDEAIVAFPSYDVLTTHLTPVRLELVQAIAEHEPESVSETADLVERDVGDVSRDIQRLEAIGLLEVDEGGPGLPTQPVVPYDRLEFRIDYPLVEDSGSDGTPASIA
ncbi:HVO_A0114 family putative DNA-binding protein [Natronobacterium texcoconense]|uniref:Predicted transcriptional regulator n=1 Tax=Natronobacterium texcoconense TaxID=1095778 RepID=A0A1H1CE63_NATTX|nr:helix-turn-helix domain-containing protein [Natronobacterium texcoconense]SDQ62420.1 Predicted transcriptional regulator [Natronobacterium texcoconense]